MDNPLISIIVPVYKVEPYLRKCVDSILCQTYTNIEVFLVDDGSPDNCPVICDEYAARDNRVKVIHKKNGGLSDARNSALDIMHGEYVTFIDSDDYVSVDYVEILYRLLIVNNADISCVQFIKYYEGSFPVNPVADHSFQILNSHDALQKLMYFDELETSANCKLYRSDLFQGIRYPVRKLFEDLGTTYKLLLKATKIVNSQAKKYFYLQRENSIEQSQFSTKKMDLLEMCEALRNDTLAVYPDLYHAWNCRFFCANFHLFLQIANGQFKKQTVILKKNIIDYRQSVLLDGQARKKARAAAFLSFFGIEFTRRIWSLIKLRLV